MKRQLTEDERKLSLKNLEFLETDLEYLDKVLIPRKQFTLDTAEIEFKVQLKQVQQELNNLQRKKDEIQKVIEITKDQVENGVEVKEESKEEKSEEEKND